MSNDVTRGPDGHWEPKQQGQKGSTLPLILGLAVGFGCLGVAVIGILAAIAIPNFLAMQLRAKRAESPTNIDAIRTAEKAYHAEWDAFTTVEACPPDWMSIGRMGVEWDSSWDCYRQFENLGWTPWGTTRCRYSVAADNSSPHRGDHDFEIVGECDVDGDGRPSVYQANRAEKASMRTSNNVY